MASAGVEFPFERDRLYRIRELRDFEAGLLIARQRNQALNRALRDPRGAASGWMMLRNKELAPLRLLADHIGVADSDRFLLRPEGDSFDAEVLAGKRTLRLQLTLAAPIWGTGNGPHRNSGYQHHQTMVALNEHGCVMGHPPFTCENDVAVGAVNVITSEDRHQACLRGLASAISNKKLCDGRGLILGVFAQDFYFQLLDTKVFQGIVDMVLTDHRLSFDLVCVFDQPPNFLVKRSGAGRVETRGQRC